MASDCLASFRKFMAEFRPFIDTTTDASGMWTNVDAVAPYWRTWFSAWDASRGEGRYAPGATDR